ncbi:DnaJ family domain-containing protein [Desulfoluna butyratoxydans]|uniref:Dnaj homologue subfamily c member 28 conserved domain n=1 Tax=Desulfoluna butyratoxydans TaxID=231438 RepID=A0A4U8YGZ0_9BACT|nr:DnaJ family domain-containing protein [Desulfoluna butyratoxydans]VFQ42490.1 dnaj homologue subfamily c member 28 conserved domain [Desulfoluna butyratoxydans]
MRIGFNRIIEEKILKAQEDGKLDNLPGLGKPLEMEDDSRVPEDLRLTHKILKNAGCVPRELEDHVEIRRTEDLLRESDDLSETYRAMKRLRLLKAKLLRDGRSQAIFDIPEAYQEGVLNRLNRKQNG